MLIFVILVSLFILINVRVCQNPAEYVQVRSQLKVRQPTPRLGPLMHGRQYAPHLTRHKPHIVRMLQSDGLILMNHLAQQA